MSSNTIISFDDVSFGFEEKKPLLDEVSFNVREGAKITLMGQNGAGKSTILKLITEDYKPRLGKVNVFPDYTIGTAHQVMRTEEGTHRGAILSKLFHEKFDIGRRIVRFGNCES